MQKILLKIIALLIFIALTCISDIAFNLMFAGKEKPIPILTYHSVTDKNFTEYENMFIKPKEFEKQINFILHQGYTPIFANEIEYASYYKKPIILTFDDGYIDNYQIVFPIIKKYNFKITIFLTTGLLNKHHFMTSNDVREMSDSGLVNIQSHTVSHKLLTTLNDTQLEKELSASKIAIQNLTKKMPTAISYPFGSINCDQLKVVSKYYQLGFTTSSGVLSNGYNKYIIKRYQINREITLDILYNYLNTFENMNPN